MDNRYHNSWDRDNFYYHRKDPTPWQPIHEPIRIGSKIAEFIKSIIIAVVLAFAVGYVVNAKADTIAHIDNNLGGKIVITDTKCTTGAGHVAYSTNPKGESLLGCWVHDDSFIHILWNGNVNFNSYAYSGWVVTSKKQAPNI